MRSPWRAAASAVLSSTLARRAASELPTESAITQTWRRRVLAFVDARNLAAPELGPELLMRRFQISRAHLYRMFAHRERCFGTWCAAHGWRAAYRERASRGSARSITTIATDFAFSSSSQVLAQRSGARFGVTPSEARNEASLSVIVDGWQSGVRAHLVGMREWAPRNGTHHRRRRIAEAARRLPRQALSMWLARNDAAPSDSALIRGPPIAMSVSIRRACEGCAPNSLQRWQSWAGCPGKTRM